MLRLALIASLTAAGLGWLSYTLYQSNARLRAENRGLQEAAKVTNQWIAEQRARDQRLLNQIGELANVPETYSCGPGVSRALDLLRDAGRP